MYTTLARGCSRNTRKMASSAATCDAISVMHSEPQKQNRFSRSGGRTNKHVVISVVQRVKYLRLSRERRHNDVCNRHPTDLDGIKMRVRVERLNTFVLEGCDGKRLKIKQLCVARVQLGKNEMFERHSNGSVGPDQTVSTT